ncbi:MAG: ABC transporter substrate-binding protein [Oscillospiraceae bacterium]|jgi:putative ABC transport system substrate-binding protein|nr:ABC transporter substrate-binding protein [Oscillospiraceae bacterium]
MKLAKCLSLLLVLALILGLAGCSPAADSSVTAQSQADPGESPAAGTAPNVKIPEIGIIQMMEHVALSLARDGFIQALADNGFIDGETIKLNIQIGSGDTSNLATIADQFVGNMVDLILAIATPAAQSVAGKTSSIPILGTAITDYVSAGLIDSVEVPGRNVSGTSDMNPIEDQIDLLLRFVPDAETIGFLYNSSEDNSKFQIDIAKAYVESKGLKWKEITVANSNDVQQAVTSIVGDVDALYLPTDNVFASTMPTVYGVTADSKTPVICAETGMVENGGLATLGISYYDLGYQTGLMAADVLKNGTDVSTMPIEFAKGFEYTINGDVAAAIGIEIPEDLQQYVIAPNN